jgi:hypothetical protein
MVERGEIADHLGVDVTIKRRDETTAERRFAPGDRIVFTMNDRELGVANGVAGTVRSIERGPGGADIVVELDDPNPQGERTVRAPASFGWFDNALASTAHRSQGRTFDSAHVLANPSMADREWIYVAASRSRFATTLHVDASALGLANTDSHDGAQPKPSGRAAVIDALAGRMRRSRAKGTTLDFETADIEHDVEAWERRELGMGGEMASGSTHAPPPGLTKTAHALASKVARAFRRRLGGLRAPTIASGGGARDARLQADRDR